MLAVLISVPISVAALWLGVNTVLRMSRLKAGWAWWAGLGVVVFFGGCAGFWLGNYELEISPRLRWVGLPMPIGFFVLEDEHWTDFIPPRPIQWLNLLADCLGPILILLIPLAIIWRKRDKARKGEWGAQRRPRPGGAVPGDLETPSDSNSDMRSR